MKSRFTLISLAAAAASVVIAVTLPAQGSFFSPEGSFAVEVSLDNATRPRLPIYRNRMTSLAVVGDYVIGGTKADQGLSPFLFAVSLSRKSLEAVLDLAEVVPGQRAIQSGFGWGRAGVLYAGTIPDAEGASGHLIEVQLVDNEFHVRDLGQVVSGEGIFSITADSLRGMVYGITHPNGRFFAYNISTGRAMVYEETSPTKKQFSYYHHYALEVEDFLSRSLVLDRKGRVYGSKPVNRLFRFDPESGAIEVLP
ncbi:MAG: hypothetical protein U9P14_04600, partial [Gemmatimonadota bacterium]|nr:hypothetical protein [Gemmatimonadota bacterium]